MGTATEHKTPVIKAMIDVCGSVELEITGNEVSIAVAPAAETDSSFPIYLAIIGISIRAIISLNTLDRKANALNSTYPLDKSMVELKLYQPKPAPMAPASFIFMFKKTPINILPTMLPTITAKGTNNTLSPNFLILSRISFCFPMSIPTKNNNTISPMSIIIPILLENSAGRKKYPVITPNKTEVNILRLNFLLLHRNEFFY